MTALERVMQAITNQEIRDVPVAPQLTAKAAQFVGATVRDFVTQAGVMANALLTAQRKFAYDMVVVAADNSVEAEALGVHLNFPEQEYPYVDKYLSLQELFAAAPPDPLTTKRMPVLLEACSLLRKDLGDSVPVIGKVVGPMTIAGQLIGLERLLYLIADAPEQFGLLLDFTTGVAARFGEALMSAGAHGLVLFEPAGSSAVLPADIFRNCLVPRLRWVLNRFAKAGATIRWLHIVGKVHSILPCYQELPVNLVSLDYENSLVEARKILPEICFIGNIRPFLFVSGSPDEIEEEAGGLLAQAKGRLILSSGCELPLPAKDENIAALVRAAREYSEVETS